MRKRAVVTTDRSSPRLLGKKIFPSLYFSCLAANEDIFQSSICTYIAAVIILCRAIDLAQRESAPRARERRNCSSVDATSRRPWHVAASSFILPRLTSTDLRRASHQISLSSLDRVPTLPDRVAQMSRAEVFPKVVLSFATQRNVSTRHFATLCSRWSNRFPNRRTTMCEVRFASRE